jgi:hypothetical protein
VKKKIIAIIVAVALLTVGFTAIPIMADAAAGTMTHVQLTPENVTLGTGALQHFTAQALDKNNQPVSNVNYFWVVTAGGGIIDSAGIFTAGPTAGTYADTVEVIAVQGKNVELATASVIVATTTNSVTYVLVTPANAKIATSSTQAFTAQAYDSNNNAITGLTYVWAATGAGTIDSSGLFTAATSAGKASITATVQGISGSATVKVTGNTSPTTTPTTTPNENHGKITMFNMFKRYLKGIGSDNFLGGTWQVKNSSGTTDTYNLISGVVQTVSATTPITLTVLPNGQTTGVPYTITTTTVIQPKDAVFAANDKVIILTVNNQVTMISKITADSTTQLPPGLKKNNNDNRQGKDTPPGWSQGKKTGWNKDSSNNGSGSESNGN